MSVTPIHRWETHTFPWGTAVREQRTKKWTNIFISPNAQEIKLDGIDVILHDNGIEFIQGVR